MKQCRECGKDIFIGDDCYTIDGRIGDFCSEGCARSMEEGKQLRNGRRGDKSATTGV